MKIVSYFFCFFLVGCVPPYNIDDLKKDIKDNLEKAECPFISQPPASN